MAFDPDTFEENMVFTYSNSEGDSVSVEINSVGGLKLEEEIGDGKTIIEKFVKFLKASGFDYVEGLRVIK